jgi:TetR/AcrR family transcriptional repressor of nem operon
VPSGTLPFLRRFDKKRPIGYCFFVTKGERTRQNIVEEAAAVFNQRGFSGSSISELCERTRLQKGGLYRHFSGKEELALEAFDYAVGVAVEARMVRGDENPQLTPVELLKLVIGRFVSPSRPLVPGGCPIFNAAVDSDDGNPALRDRVEQALSDWLTRLGRLAQSAIERGELASTIDPEQVAIRIVASLEGALMISRVQRSNKALVSTAEQLCQWLDELGRVDN